MFRYTATAHVGFVLEFWTFGYLWVERLDENSDAERGRTWWGREKKNSGGATGGKEMTPASKAAAPPATIRLVNFISEDQARPRTLAFPLFPSLARWPGT